MVASLRADDLSPDRYDHTANIIAWSILSSVLAALSFAGGFIFGGLYAPPVADKMWLDEWQTLVGSIITVVAAAGAAFAAWIAVQRQINAARNIAADERAARHTSHRAALPISIAKIQEFCKEASDIVAQFCENRISFDEFIDQYKRISLTGNETNAIDNVKECSGFADQKSSTELSILIIFIQIIDARIKKMDNPSISTIDSNPENLRCILDLASLHIYCDGIYDYARGFSKETNPSLDISGIDVLISRWQIDRLFAADPFNLLSRYTNPIVSLKNRIMS